MKVHVLTGDHLASAFNQTGIEGDIIISRECLIAGNTTGNTLHEIWQSRANYIQTTYLESIENYYLNVAYEYEKLLNLPSSAEVYLWFEYDLFCQVNMWFTLWLIHTRTFKAVYRVAPITRESTERWKGFGSMDSKDLVECHASKMQFNKEDVALGANLWLAYQSGNVQQLQTLSESNSACFPYLSEVCAAHIERILNRRVEKVLQEIMAKGVTDFVQIFKLFSHREGVYGFGDMQVKEIYKTLISE
jgi:hypothetical protein